MIQLDGFIVTDLLYEGDPFSIYKGVEKSNKEKVLIRTYTQKSDMLWHYIALKQNHSISNQLDGEAIIASRNYIVEHDQIIEILEDDGSEPLPVYLEKFMSGEQDFAKTATLFTSISSALQALHQCQLLHLGLNPSAIFVHPETNRVKLTGFIRSYFTFNAPENSGNIQAFEGLMHYISPEQTGRINKVIDQRSDLYSLGMTFYEILTQKKPFEGLSGAELVHAHIASSLAVPETENPEVPLVLSKIVGKLANKEQEARYQSAHGLCSDLKSNKDFDSKEEIHLGAKDVSDRFVIPTKIYGRADQFNTVRTIIEDYAGDDLDSLLITGTRGIGKSLLVKEIRSLGQSKNSQILSYKCSIFDQLKPMSAIAGVIQSMLDSLFTLPVDGLKEWKSQIVDAIGNQSEQLVTLVPAMENIVGTVKKSAKTTLQEEEDRFIKVLTELLRVYGTNNSSVFLIVENLERCDEASAHVLKSIFTDIEPLQILFIGTADTDEAGGKSWLEEFETPNGSSKNNIINLDPLTTIDVAEFMADVLQCSSNELGELAEILRNKSGGIPRHLVDVLSVVRGKGLISFNYQTNNWQWDTKEIALVEEPSDVAELLIKRANALSARGAEAINVASCIGMVFSLEVLASVLDKQLPDTLDLLADAENAGIIKSKGIGDSRNGNDIAEDNLYLEFTVYDVWQSIYNGIDNSRKEEIHLKTGKELLTTLDKTQADVFEIANHLHIGFNLITVAGDNSDLLDVFRDAGVKAKSTRSYSLAFTYLNHAKNLTTSALWLSNYESLHNLLLDLVETAFLSGEEERAEALFEESLGISRTNLDKAKLYEVRVRVQVHLSDLKGSFKSGNKGLKLLNAALPKKPGKLGVGGEIIKSMLLLRKRSFDEILNLPDMDDKEQLIILNIYYLLLPYAQASPELYSLIALRMMQGTIKNGIHPSSFSGFTVYGSILTIGLGKIERGFQFMIFAKKIAKRSNSMAAEAGALFGLGMQGVFKESLRDCILYFEEAFKLSDLAGSKFYASTSTNHLMIYNFLIGDNLQSLALKINDYLEYAEKANEKATVLMQHSAKALVRALSTTDNYEREKIIEEFNNEEEMIPILWTWHIILRQAYNYITGDYDKAFAYSQKIEDKLESTSFHLMYHYYQFFTTMTLGRVYQSLPQVEKKKEQKKAGKSLKKLLKLKKFSPNIFEHLYYSQLAITQIMKGDTRQGIDSFHLAIEAIEDEEFLFQRAIYLEQIALLNEELSQRDNTTKAIQQAYRLYEKWGASAKTVLLLEKYPYELSGLIEESEKVDEVDIKWAMTESSLGTQGSQDINTIVDSIQTISKEIKLENVLRILIKVAMKYAGAQTGFISMYEDDDLQVKIAAEFEGNELSLFEKAKSLNISYPTSVLNYVRQTQQTLLLDDASKSEQFGLDPYIVDKSPKSILTMAIGKKDRLLGIMYFENNLTTGAFTKERLNLLELLANQAGISLQNAQLYADMVKLNTAYQRFVPLEFLNLLEKSSITDLELGSGITRTMTILFSDIRGFTSMSEQMDPKEAFSFLNDYLGTMEPIIKRNNGFIDKFMGDGIMALFPGNADDAVDCCLEMMTALEKFNNDRETPVEIGMGLNTGSMMLGTVGGKDRMDGTVISDAVNVASRLEQLTKEFSVQLLVSSETVIGLKNPSKYNISKVDKVEAVGRKEKVEVYTINVH
jgi:predicted ATPase/class 3 adenylate cyclase